MQLSLQPVWPVLASNPPIAGQTVLFNLVLKTAAIHTAMAISTPVRRNVIISNRKTLIVKVDISNSAKKDSISIRKTRRNPARRGSKSLGSDDMEKGALQTLAGRRRRRGNRRQKISGGLKSQLQPAAAARLATESVDSVLARLVDLHL